MHVRIDPNKGEVEVDGKDVSSVVRRVTLDHRAGQVPEVYLELNPNGNSYDGLEVEGVVHVVRETTDPEAVRAWLAAIDAETLEREALGRMGGFGGNTSTGEAFLAVLRDWATGG